MDTGSSSGQVSQGFVFLFWPQTNAFSRHDPTPSSKKLSQMSLHPITTQGQDMGTWWFQGEEVDMTLPLSCQQMFIKHLLCA